MLEELAQIPPMNTEVSTVVAKAIVAGKTVSIINPADPSYLVIAYHQGHGGSMGLESLKLI